MTAATPIYLAQQSAIYRHSRLWLERERYFLIIIFALLRFRTLRKRHIGQLLARPLLLSLHFTCISQSNSKWTVHSIWVDKVTDTNPLRANVIDSRKPGASSYENLPFIANRHMRMMAIACGWGDAGPTLYIHPTQCGPFGRMEKSLLTRV